MDKKRLARVERSLASIARAGDMLVVHERGGQVYRGYGGNDGGIEQEQPLTRAELAELEAHERAGGLVLWVCMDAYSDMPG